MSAANNTYLLSDLASRFQLDLTGDGEIPVSGVGTLHSAGPEQLSFLANPGYRKDLPGTRAAAVILRQQDQADCPVPALVSDDPYLSYARIAQLFLDNAGKPATGIHPSAVIDPSAELGKNLSVGPHVCIGPDCHIGDGCSIGAGSVIGAGSRLGAGCVIHPNVTIAHRIQIGKRVIVHSGAVIGSDGFGLAFAADHWEKVPQLGGVIIGDDCEIGANTTIDRGAIEDTVLEEDVRLDNQVQIAHNVHVGAHTAMAARAGVAGSTRIGKYCMLAGNSAATGHVDIADRTTIAGASVAFSSIDEAGQTWSGLIPAQPIKDWHKNLSRLRRLDEFARRLIKLEKSIGKNNTND